MEHCDSDYYADGATVHTHGNIQNDIEAKLQHDGNNTKSVCKQNKMEINYGKTTCMNVGNQHSTKNTQPSTGRIRRRKSSLDRTYCTIISSKISLFRQLSTYILNDAQNVLPMVYFTINRLWLKNLG